MIADKKILAIVPARGGSKGLPGKNIRMLCGKPLIAWPIHSAKKSRYIDQVIVSTDDPEIAEIAQAEGAEVPFLRPPELATDTATSISVIEHAVGYLAEEGESFNYCVLLEPTSPMTENKDVDSALERLDRQRDIADAIVGISMVEGTHPAFDVVLDERKRIHPYLQEGFDAVTRRQEIENLYFLDGSLYISDIEVLLKRQGFYHERTLGFKMPKWKSFEVDDIVDFFCIEAIMNNRDRIE